MVEEARNGGVDGIGGGENAELKGFRGPRWRVKGRGSRRWAFSVSFRFLDSRAVRGISMNANRE
jgi:hypothetical protein